MKVLLFPSKDKSPSRGAMLLMLTAVETKVTKTYQEYIFCTTDMK